MTKQQLVPLKKCIRAWESSSFYDKFLMSPSTRVIVESTISYLKKLEDYEAQFILKAQAPKVVGEKSSH